MTNNATNPAASKSARISPVISSEADQEPSVKIFQGSKPALKNWRIASAEDSEAPVPEQFDDAPHAVSHERLPLDTPLWLRAAQIAGAAFTLGWLTYSVFYVVALPPESRALLASPLALGGLVAAVFAPIALVWVCLATLQRRNDAQIYAEALRSELQRLLFPTPDQARVVNRDIQLLVQQAVELSSSSRTAIKAIQTARQGMRAEVRDFAAVSQKTEFHIDRLAETLNKRADDLLSLTAQLEQRTQSLVAGADQHTKTWETSVETLNQRAEDVARHLTQGSALIASALSNAEDKVRIITSGFSTAGDALSSRTQKLADVASEIQTSSTLLQNVLDEKLSGLVETQEKITSGLGDMESAAESLVTRGEVVVKNMSAQSQNLREAVDGFSARTRDLEQVGQTASNKLGEALSLALSGSENIMATVRRAREQMEKAANETLARVTEFETQSSQRATKLHDVIEDQINKLQDLLNDYDGRTEKTANVLRALETHNNTASDVATRLEREVSNSIMRLDAAGESLKRAADTPVDSLRSMTVQLSDTISDMAKLLESRMQDTQERTDKIQETAGHLSQKMQERVQELATLTGQIIGQTRSIEAQISTQRSSLSGFTSEAATKLEDLQTRLASQSQNLMQQVRDTEAAILSLGADFTVKSSETLAQAHTATATLRATEDEILERLVALAANAAQTQFTVQDVAKILREVAHETIPVYEKAANKAEELERKFANLDQTVRATAGDVNERLGDIAAQIETNLKALDDQSATSFGKLTALSEDLKGQTDHIVDAADKADEKLRALQNGLKGRADDVQIISDQAALRLEALRKTLDSYVKDLTQNVAASITQLSSVNDVFAETSQGLDDKSRAASDKLRQVTQDFVEEGHRISLLAEQAAHRAVRVVQSVRDESTTMCETADESLLALSQASNSFAARAREIEEYMKATLRSTQSTSEELKSQVQNVATQSAKAVDSIVDHISRLSLKAEETRQLGDRISQNVDESREKLADESERLLQVTRKATQSAEDTAQSFVRHGSLILKAADDIAQQADRLKDNQTKAQRETFLSSVKFVVESLHSLAVDVARHLESDIDDKAWRSFQKGDVASFTRRLVEIAPHIPLPHAREKFEKDGEFRNYTQRYLRQFEELLDQARTLDHGELLVGAFASSDMARLYRVLCDVAGRPARL
jgi:DNA repair exonuclease SbcCD ATPase subunit